MFSFFQDLHQTFDAYFPVYILSYQTEKMYHGKRGKESIIIRKGEGEKKLAQQELGNRLYYFLL